MPSCLSFASVISAWSKSPHQEAAVRAHAFLDNLEQLHNSGMLLDVEPDRISYNTVISGYQRSESPGAAEEAERVFNSLQKQYEETNDKRYQPDVVTICSLLGAYANKGNAHRAEELLLQVYKKSSDKNNIVPDSSCFDQVLLAWAKKGSERSARRAEMLLKLMEDISSSKPSLAPTTSTCNIVLYALSNSGDFSAPFRAQILLERMKSGELGKKVRPDTVTWTTTISVIARLGGRDTVPTIQKLFRQATEAPNCKMDAVFMANVLSSLAYCNQDGALEYSVELVGKQMIQLSIKPTLSTMNALLNVYAKKGKAEQAEAVLESMEAGPLDPDGRSYTLVLDALAKDESLSSIKRAESIVRRMQESKSCKPSVQAFTALIQKYARSNLPFKSKRAQVVLEQMKEGASSLPTIVTYNALLNACEYTDSNDLKEKEEAFAIACLTFDEIRKHESINPTHVTYGSFIGSVTALMPRSDARNEIAELVFKRAKQDGQVSQYVLRKLKSSVSLSTYKRMLGGRREDSLPASWTIDVRERKSSRSTVQRKPSTTQSGSH